MSTSWLSHFLPRRVHWIMSGVLLFCLLATVVADPARDNGAWKFDTVRLKSGRVLRGLIDKEDQDEVHLRCVLQNPDSPATVIRTSIERSEIKERGIERVDAKDREILKARMDALDRTILMQELEKLVLEAAEWPEAVNKGFSYRSDHFVLISNAQEEIVRRVAYQLGQIFKAYSCYLPPRHAVGPPTRIMLYQTMGEYHEALRKQGRYIANPALYDPVRNEIICASELKQLGEDLKKCRTEHLQLKKRLEVQEREWDKIYNKKIPTKLRKELASASREIDIAEAANHGIYEKATQRLFQTLYHESFHAYLANFVYHRNEAEVPRWLNEGLAQLFENAILEGGTLRVGHADRLRLAQAQALLKDGKLPSIADLLRSGPKQFLIGHTDDRAISDQYYLMSWAVAFYLTFDLGKLHSPEMTTYVQALKRGTDPVKAFCDFVGRPLSEFEKAFYDYLRRLRPSGSTARPGE
jgi:hypothetical protein